MLKGNIAASLANETGHCAGAILNQIFRATRAVARRLCLEDADDILRIADTWHTAGQLVAIATVVATWGSAPRPQGSLMAVTASGQIAGSVSGGCVEAAVATAAQHTITTGLPQTLVFGITNDRAWEVGLACGGQLTVFVERLG